jgi:phosphate starvation-inducible protein PhoH
MQMFLTRMGYGSKCVVTGDTSQVDLPRGTDSGLIDAEHVLARVKGIGFTRFTAADVVRHPLVARIVEAYERQLPGSLRSPPAKGARSRPGDPDPEPARAREAGA